jgi:hypothetical protein
MKNSKFLDNYKKAIVIYIIYIVLVILLIVYISLLSYYYNKFQIPNQISLNSLILFITYIINNLSLYQIFSIHSNSILSSESISQSINFIGIVLALLFTLIILPMQHILGKYPQELVDRVLRDNTFRFTLFFFVFVFIFELFELIIFSTIDNNYAGYIALNINFTLIILSLVTLISFIFRIFDLMDIRNHLDEITDETLNLIPVGCNKKNYKNKIVNNQENKNKIFNNTEIIIDSLQKSLQENRFEISLSGLNNIEKIISTYIDNCKKRNNEFISLIISSLYDTKDIISSNTNPKVLEKIISVSIKLGKEMLKLEKIPSHQVLKIVDLLEEIVLSSEIIKKSYNHQIKGIFGLFNLATLSFSTENYILRKITKSLGRISRFKEISTRLRTRSNEKIIRLLFLSYDNIDKIRKYDFEEIIEEIDMIIISSDSPNKNFINPQEIRPFLNPIRKYSLANFFMKIRNNPDEYEVDLMKSILTKFSIYLELYIMSDNLPIEYLYLFNIGCILDSTYKTLAINVSTIYKSNLQVKLIKILEIQIDILYSIIEYTINYPILKFKFKEFIGLIPLSFNLMLIYNKESIFDDVIEKSVLKIFGFINIQLGIYDKKVKNKELNNNRKDKSLNIIENVLIDSYPYLRLTGAILFEKYKTYNFMIKVYDILNKYQTVGLYDKILFYPDMYYAPHFGDIDEEELKNNLEYVNHYFNQSFEEYDKFIDKNNK